MHKKIIKKANLLVSKESKLPPDGADHALHGSSFGIQKYKELFAFEYYLKMPSFVPRPILLRFLKFSLEEEEWM